jgi:DNA-binding transcriptional ArsR family regulator
MSHYMTALAMKQKGLKPATKVVLYWLADHHNETTKECFPRIARLAELCDMSRRSVESHINILEGMGLIQRINRFREQGGKTSNGYILYLSESDTQNLRIPSENSAHGDTQNLRMNNLGKDNLGTNNNIFTELEQSEFDLFWDYYPKKVAKGDARKAFKKALAKISGSELLLAVRPYADSVKHKDPKFIPHAATWLNGERWADQLDQSKDAGMDENMMLNVLKEVGLKYDA